MLLTYSLRTYCGSLLILASMGVVAAQTQNAELVAKSESDLRQNNSETAKPLVVSVLPAYYSQDDGVSLAEIVRRAFDNNGEIKLARLEVERAKARFTQAGLRSNPTLEFEQTTGRLVGSPGEGELSVGVSVPLDVYGQRKRRLDLAQAEITLREAEVTARQRELANQIFTSYSEALASLKEIATLEDLLELDTRTVQFVQIRVNEGEVAPLELNLLQTEVERLRARRQLVEGKLQAALSKLRYFAGLSFDQPFRLREEITTAQIPQLPPSIETGLQVALRNRPEIRLAELEETVASAGLRLVRSQSKPDVTAYSRYTQGRSGFDDPRGPYFQRDRSLTFGVAIGLPVFNKNQGAKAEAEVAIRIAQERKVFAERMIQGEVAAAFQRIEAARRSVLTLETAVLPRSRQNIDKIREVYQIGELKITDLIAEQRRLLDANRDLTEALTERYRAQADLFIALGITL
ncbi:MAG TPA: TolC family protein [Pyrinomonadaceae bacterium]|nr:TolC family protein [Pyrinomonadaceae bacterium]